LLTTLLIERGLSQSVDIHERKPDEVVVAFYFDHRLIVEIEAGRKERSRLDDDDYLSRGMVPPRSVHGSQNQTLLSHTPKELDDDKKYHQDKRTSDGKLVSSPGTLVYRFSNVPGEEYRFKISAARPCDKCVTRFGEDSISYEVRIDFFTDDPQNRVVFVENPNGSISSGTYGQSINVKNRSGDFSVRCIDYRPRKSTGENNPSFRLYAINDELSAFREFADQVYLVEQMPSSITVYGDLGAEHSKSQHADLSSGELSPRFLESFIYGDSRTHRLKKYTFEVIDIANGGGWYESNVKHPAGEIPAGFKAITLRCTCCPNDPKYVVSFAGTDPLSPSDLLNDALQGIPIVNIPYSNNPIFPYPGWKPGLPLFFNSSWPLSSGRVATTPPMESRVAPHYEYAVRYTSWVKKRFKINSYLEPGTRKIQAVGHSLGGGMASYVSGYHKIAGYGFNSAPLGAGKQINDVMKKADQYFVQIRAIGDPVSGLSILPFQELPGVIVDVECKSWIPILGKHSVTNISDKILSYR
jgi:hypothetical protein